MATHTYGALEGSLELSPPDSAPAPDSDSDIILRFRSDPDPDHVTTIVLSNLDAHFLAADLAVVLA